MEKLVINKEINVIFEDTESGKGRIYVNDIYSDRAWSYFWGSMGSDLKTFITQISSDYFAGKLCFGPKWVFDLKKTKTNLRKELATFLPWYKEMEFQKEFREVLREADWESKEEFVYSGSERLKDLGMYIEDRYERKNYEEWISSEPWYFTIDGESQEYLRLIQIHKLIKKELNGRTTKRRRIRTEAEGAIS